MERRASFWRLWRQRRQRGGGGGEKCIHIPTEVLLVGVSAGDDYVLVGVVEEVEVDELLDLERLRRDVLDDLGVLGLWVGRN